MERLAEAYDFCNFSPEFEEENFYHEIDLLLFGKTQGIGQPIGSDFPLTQLKEVLRPDQTNRKQMIIIENTDLVKSLGANWSFWQFSS